MDLRKRFASRRPVVALFSDHDQTGRQRKVKSTYYIAACCLCCWGSALVDFWESAGDCSLIDLVLQLIHGEMMSGVYDGQYIARNTENSYGRRTTKAKRSPKEECTI